MRCVLIATVFVSVLLISACGHTDPDAGDLNISEGETRTITSGDGLEVYPGDTYRLTFSPAVHLEERSGDCQGAITHRADNTDTYTTRGSQTACVVIYCASGCSSVEVGIDRTE